MISCFDHFLSLLALLSLGGGGGGGGGHQLICVLNVLLLVLAVAIHVVYGCVLHIQYVILKCVLVCDILLLLL